MSTSLVPDSGASPADSPNEEELTRMSFGDHLEELRRRLIWAILAMVLGVVVVLPFKDGVTDIYVRPYHSMWDGAYSEWLSVMDERQEEVAARIAALGEGEAPSTSDELFLKNWSFHDKHRQEILDGTFPQEFYDQIGFHGFPIPRTLKALGGLEDFWVFMAATFLFGLILALPVVLYQLWAFVAAGLYSHERSVVMQLLPLALGLTAIGVLFGYFVMVPTGLYFLTRMMDFGNVQPLFSVQQYFSFLLTLTAALGAVFQLPLLMMALQKVGLFTHTQMRKNWRMVVLGCFILSAMITPPDPSTQLLMAMPMLTLFAIGLLITWRMETKAAAAAEA